MTAEPGSPSIGRPLQGRRWISVVMVVATFFSTALIAALLHDRFLAGRDRSLVTTGERIETQLNNQLHVLGAMKGLTLALGAVPTGRQVATFLESLPESVGLTTALGYGFALAVTAANIDAGQTVALKSYPYAPEIWPTSAEDMRTPIVVLEPQDARNQRAISYDMYSEAVRRDAMKRAAIKRAPAISRPVTLVQEDDGKPQPGVLIYVPVFTSEGVQPPPRAGLDGLVGFVYAPIRVGDLVASAVDRAAMPALHIAISQVEDGTDLSLYRMSGAAPRGRALSMIVSAADRNWRLDIAEVQPIGLHEFPAFYVLLLGGSIALLVGLLSRSQEREVAMNRSLAAASLAKSEAREVLLGEMQHRIKNSIARKLAMFRLSVRETRDRPGLIEAFEARMLAMAKAQDLLSNSPDGGGSVKQLLVDDLGTWQSDNKSIRIGGPDVKLDSAQLQAFALIFYELTTNSLKYGALAAGTPLEVSWRVDHTTASHRFMLKWHEALPEDQKAENSGGFGSRLVRMMTESQLKGHVTRQIGKDGLDIEFDIPLDHSAAD